MSVLIKLSHLLLCLHLGVHALPIVNLTQKLEQKQVPPETSPIVAPVGAPVPLLLPKIKIPKNYNLTDVAHNLKKFGIHSLKDDRHLEGHPLDRHGKANPEFHRELFLGNHELFESDIQNDERKRDKKLEEIFRL